MDAGAERPHECGRARRERESEELSGCPPSKPEGRAGETTPAVAGGTAAREKNARVAIAGSGFTTGPRVASHECRDGLNCPRKAAPGR